MRIKTEFCHNCGIARDQAVLGLMPTVFTDGDKKPLWKKALLCSECGDLNFDSVTNQEIEQAHERYLKALVELGLETEESVEKKSGVKL